MRSPFVLPQEVRSYSQYAEFNVGTETVLAALGYDFVREPLALPAIPVAQIPEARRLLIRELLDTALRRIGFQSEMARREFLMAPVVLEVARLADAELAPEHPFNVSPQLRGSLDYLLQKQNAIIVIEAKNADMMRGFTQLAAEMIALDTFADAEITSLYGAVTTGTEWRFGVLDRTEKRVSQDIKQFAIPDELDELLAVLVGILQDAPPRSAAE